MNVAVNVKRILALVLVMSFVAVSPALAQQQGDVPIDVKVGVAPNAGLSWTAAETSAFQDVAYSFDPQTVTGTMSVGVTDSRGTDAGWTISIQAGNFTGATTGRTIPIGNFALSAGPVQVLTGQAAPLPTANSFAMSSSPQTLMSAVVNSGAGRYGLSYTATLLIPGNTAVDTYGTTLNVNLTTAP